MWLRSLAPKHPAVVGVLLVALLAAACSSDTPDPGASGDATTPADTGWSLTDDEPATVTLDALPERIVMHEDVAATLMDFGIRPIGIFGTTPIEDNPRFDDFDMTGIESVGSAYGEINIEKLAALQPDLILASQWGSYEKDPPFGLSSFKQMDSMAEFAPILALQATRPAPFVLERYAELAESLGADLSSDDITAKRERYEEATARLETAVADHPEISVLAMDAASLSDGVYVAHPEAFPDLWGLKKLFGVAFAEPENHNGYWELLSPERIDTYPSDIILFDSRAGGVTTDDLAKGNDLWTTLPAVEAGQIVPWYVPGSGSYTQDAASLELLAEAYENADDVA